MSAIGFYLYHVYAEAASRGYNFAVDKILVVPTEITPIEISEGQIRFEFELLRSRLRTRDPERCERLSGTAEIEPHPIFIVVSGNIEPWEKRR